MVFWSLTRFRLCLEKYQFAAVRNKRFDFLDVHLLAILPLGQKPATQSFKEETSFKK